MAMGAPGLHRSLAQKVDQRSPVNASRERILPDCQLLADGCSNIVRGVVHHAQLPRDFGKAQRGEERKVHDVLIHVGVVHGLPISSRLHVGVRCGVLRSPSREAGLVSFRHVNLELRLAVQHVLKLSSSLRGPVTIGAARCSAGPQQQLARQ
eukprot:3555339-Pleurochrysis_carterae.AAC.2